MPTEVADLSEGETVLDLGSGGGADVLISAKRVGPSGQAIGLDMTDEMLELARKHALSFSTAESESNSLLEQDPGKGPSSLGLRWVPAQAGEGA